MNEQTAVVLGASGLIGNYLVEQLLQDDYFGTVRVLARRKIAFNHPKLQQVQVDFNDINDYTNKFGKGDIIFCSIGTTQKKVKGDKAAYEKIDHDIPVNAAHIGITNGYKKFLIVSAAGANSSSSNFYLRLKGKIENDIKQFAFETISFFRPSMLLGKRDEWRPAEKMGQVFMQLFSFMFIGSLNKYHPIKAEDVAKAMITESKQTKAGIHILEYKEMMKLIR
ncbi:MAG: Semialdehyde dehydrogenase - binding protein [Chitinophagaceae bacterium]|nr:Semialdehyde dehydrogenase - binding protein [Chitinophagaceae bacterium]